MLLRFLQNHVLANLTFALILIIGIISYLSLPRQQDPDINFNWIVVSTVMPGASALDIEKLITDPIEHELKSLSDIKFISSNSRQNVSSLLVRFNQIAPRLYDKRLAELRREIQNIQDEFPEAADTPRILEIVSANAFPAATILIKGVAFDENLRTNARQVINDLRRIKGVDRVDNYGFNDPEIQIRYDRDKLQQHGINPTQLADSIRLLFQDVSAGSINFSDKTWLVRLEGKSQNLSRLNQLPIISHSGYVPLSQLATIAYGQEKSRRIVSSNQQPTILLAVLKQAGSNTLDLIDKIKFYIQDRNQFQSNTGVELVLVDDQSEITSNAINIMQTNALLGLGFVLIITFTFLGSRIAFITTLGIPFILAGTFWILSLMGQTLNVSVLLAVVIALGMLVDDAVVVAESIYHRLIQGEDRESACINALKEVFAPVTTAVLTTMAAFMPLMLLPGILGDFMRVIPLVVTISLMISLIEAYWMLPAHVLVLRFDFHQTRSRIQQWRFRFTHTIQIKYTRALIKILRFPKITLSFSFVLFVLAVVALGSDLIKKDFFASDTLRLFYINVEMDPSSPLRATHKKVEQVEQKARALLEPYEYREMVSYAGVMFTETEPRLGDQFGQVLVGLNPKKLDMRSVEQILKDIRSEVSSIDGALNISFLKLAGGPPVTKPISVKVLGDDYDEIKQAVSAIKKILHDQAAVSDISDDADLGSRQLSLKLKYDRIQSLGINPRDITRTIQLSVDGEIITSLQNNGEKNIVRLQADNRSTKQLESFLSSQIFNAQGLPIPLSELIDTRTSQSLGNISHYNFKRSIKVEADIDKKQTDVVTINNLIKSEWQNIRPNHPNISLDFSGILDDIEESLNAIIVLFIFGVGVMYMILGTQFKSYFQPLIILATVPLAFTGVIIGILINQQALSLFSLYGIVALAGIAVNSAIVLISTANRKLASGMSLLHSTVYAARRRVIPIIITTLTTIGGLLSLALGLGGESLIWGPVANAIVWGLGFSATLTLFVIPILYRLFMSRSYLIHQQNPALRSSNIELR